jgi:hypothetical protein
MVLLMQKKYATAAASDEISTTVEFHLLEFIVMVQQACKQRLTTHVLAEGIPLCFSSVG